MTLSAGNFLSSLLLLDYLDVILFRKILQRLHISHILVFHHETDSSAGLSATETLIYSLGRRYGKLRGLFVMERAAGLVIGPALLQSNEITHHVNNLRGVKYLVYSILRYHLLLVNLFVINLFSIILHFWLSSLRRLLDLIFINRLAHLPC